MRRSSTIEWINTIPKTINANGCWIPKNKKPKGNGYVEVMIDGRQFYLHRMVMCLHYAIDYDNHKIETRHNTGCDRACFNHEHLEPGSTSDNIKDSVRDKTHAQASKDVCPKCGHAYNSKTYKTGDFKGTTVRFCSNCTMIKQRARREKV